MNVVTRGISARSRPDTRDAERSTPPAERSARRPRDTPAGVVLWCVLKGRAVKNACGLRQAELGVPLDAQDMPSTWCNHPRGLNELCDFSLVPQTIQTLWPHIRVRVRECHVKSCEHASALTAIRLGNTFGTGFPQPPGAWGRVFLAQNTHGERNKIVPHPPSIFVLPAHARVRCARAPRWVQVGYEDELRWGWGTILLESPSQTSLEMYHWRRHWATPGRGASAQRCARSEAISLLLAQETCEMKKFAGTQALFDVCTASHAGALHAPAAVGPLQCTARRLSSLAMGRIEGVIDDGAARCAVGGWCSLSARRVRLELRGGLFGTTIVEWAHIRWFPRRPGPSQLPGACESRTRGSVRHDDMGSGGFTWLPGMRSMASVATSSLSRALACTRLGAICGTAECSQRARRAAHIGSLRSDVWCVSRPEWRGEALGESGRSHGEGG